MGINVFMTWMLGLRYLSLISLKFLSRSSGDLAHLTIPLLKLPCSECNTK